MLNRCREFDFVIFVYFVHTRQQNGNFQEAISNMYVFIIPQI